MRLVAIIALLLAPACILQNLSPSEKLRDAVVAYNDACRWNRLDLAVMLVDHPFRAEFKAGHHRWGYDIQIADVDILQVQTADKDLESAAAKVLYRWYDQRGMIVADTVLLQRYEKRKGNYVLLSEEVASGDPRLLEPPPLIEPSESPGARAAEDRARIKPRSMRDQARTPTALRTRAIVSWAIARALVAPCTSRRSRPSSSARSAAKRSRFGPSSSSSASTRSCLAWPQP